MSTAATLTTPIRPTTTADIDPLVELARQTGVFKPMEIQALWEVLTDYFATNQALGHLSVTFESDDGILGFAYYAPVAMTDRTWSLYWIAVKKAIQARGIGGELMRFVEDDIRRRHGRHLLIETSSLPHYEPTRKFYLKHAYQEAARVPDYYAQGDHMVIFRKQF